MYTWCLIIVAALISFLLRIAPFVLLKKSKLSADHVIFEYLNYVVYTIMGCIIYVAAFPKANGSSWLGGGDTLAWLKVGVLVAIFALACRFKHMLVNVILGILVYAVLLYALLAFS